MSKKDLRVGMKVRNTVTEKIGEVEADPQKPNELMNTAPDYVAVVIGCGKDSQYSCWYLPNVLPI